MSYQLIAEFQEEKVCLALMDHGRLVEYTEDKNISTDIAAEQIYLGVVDRIVKGMESCFVRLGKNLNGFLPFAECKERPKGGDKLFLQVKHPPVGEKVASMTTDITIAGRYVVLTPCSARYAASGRIEDRSVRAALTEKGKQFAPPGVGVIMRAESVDAAEEDIKKEIQSLYEKWQAISSCSQIDAPKLVNGRENALQRLLRDTHGELTSVITNKPECLPSISAEIHPCQDPLSVEGVPAKLEKALRRKIWLDCGGFLVIDRTEAMTVIDVNSGKYTGEKSGTESTFAKLNTEAACEIARQLRLRKLGGIIIVDFVDMKTEASRNQVETVMKDALRDDPVKTVVHGFTKLGLMEITRKKQEVSTEGTA